MQVELLAICKGLQLAKELYMLNLVLELDCQATVARINSNEEDLSALGYIIGVV